MVGRMIGLVSCLLCAFPFFIISAYDKGSKTPINFWSGDKTLREKVRDVPGYNREMAVLYRRCGLAFVAAGIGFLTVPLIGVAMICFCCTLGIYLAYRSYKRILSSYS